MNDTDDYDDHDDHNSGGYGNGSGDGYGYGYGDGRFTTAGLDDGTGIDRNRRDCAEADIKVLIP